MAGCRWGGRVTGYRWSGRAKDRRGVEIKIYSMVYLRSPENVGGVVGCWWGEGESVKDG